MQGQENDFGLWADFELEKKLNKRFDLGAELGYRLENNLTQRDETYAGLALSYSKKRFGISAGYRFTNEFSIKRTYDLAHRLMAQAMYKPKINRFTLNYRARFQIQYSAVNSTPNGHLPVSYIRNRLKLSYNVKGIPLEPSLSYEVFTRTNWYLPVRNEKQRFLAALSYKIFDNHEVTISVLKQTYHFNEEPKSLAVIGVGYKLKI